MDKEQLYRSLDLRRELVQIRLTPVTEGYERYKRFCDTSPLSVTSIMNCYHAFCLDKVWFFMEDLNGLVLSRKNYERVSVSRLFHVLLSRLDAKVINLAVNIAISKYDPSDIVAEFYSERTASMRDMKRDFPSYKFSVQNQSILTDGGSKTIL